MICALGSPADAARLLPIIDRNAFSARIRLVDALGRMLPDGDPAIAAALEAIVDRERAIAAGDDVDLRRSTHSNMLETARRLRVRATR